MSNQICSDNLLLVASAHFNDALEFAAGIYPIIFAGDLFRYLVGAIGVFAVVNVALSRLLASRKIRPQSPPLRQLAIEFAASLRTVVIFSLVGLSIALAVHFGLIRVFEQPDHWGWGYFALNIIVLIVLHDAWFYWTHLGMHRIGLLRPMHRLHHRSNNPSAFAAYSFDTSEALLNAIFFPLAVALVPSSVLAMFVFTAHMMLRNAIGHCGYEIFPARRDGRPLLGWLTTVTHHDLHHAQAGWNFGLYFTWWDRWMGTENPRYHEEFARSAASCPVRA